MPWIPLKQNDKVNFMPWNRAWRTCETDNVECRSSSLAKIIMNSNKHNNSCLWQSNHRPSRHATLEKHKNTETQMFVPVCLLPPLTEKNLRPPKALSTQTFRMSRTWFVSYKTHKHLRDKQTCPRNAQNQNENPHTPEHSIPCDTQPNNV